MGGGGGGRLFEAGRLLTFSTFRMGAYSRWALIRGWALIRIKSRYMQVQNLRRADPKVFFRAQRLNKLLFKIIATILDKNVEKIVYLGNIFLNIIAVPVFPSAPSPESNVVVYSKESLIPGHL